MYRAARPISHTTIQEQIGVVAVPPLVAQVIGCGLLAVALWVVGAS
jgi:hypothetical protein